MPKKNPREQLRDRIALLGSDKPGDRNNARRFILAFLEKHGHTLAQLGSLSVFDMLSIEDETAREEMRQRILAGLKERGETWNHLAEITAAQYEALVAPPPPPSDPRDGEPAQFDPSMHNPASLVENITKAYATMTEHVRVIYSLWVCFTHVYTRFSIAMRVALASKKPNCGKSTGLEIARYLVFRPNEEAVGTGAAIEDHFSRGPCTLLLHEVEHADAEAKKRLQRIWNVGHKKGPSSKISKMVAGKKQTISLYAPVLLAGVGKGVGRLLATQQQSRTLRLEMQKYTKETRPPRNFHIEEEIDVEAFNSVYRLLCAWAAKAKLNPKPPMPLGVIARDEDNIRGLLAIADDCGGEWPGRAREALMVVLEQQKTESPEVAILRHGLVIFETLELERVKTTEFDKELRRLDLPGVNWSRYRGPGGDENEHPITASERADLLRESGIETKPMRPVGGGKLFRGLDRSWFEAALREHEPTPAAPRLRLITPQAE
jgi:hypothetical protein